MHYEILDKRRLSILPLLSNWKDRFYLAGGTALALYFGHRDSIDFDFFTKERFDEAKLVEEIKDIFVGHKVEIIQIENQTVTALIDSDIKISFMNYNYELVDQIKSEEYLNLASITDIACMKLSAICSRSLSKDYIDLYFILKDFDLESLLKSCEIKFKIIDRAVIIKSILYFNDIVEEPVKMILEKDLTIKNIKDSLTKKVELLK